MFLLTAQPWAERGSCSARCLFLTARLWAKRGSFSARRLFFVLSVTRPKLPLGHIVSGTSNHATYDVYSPKAVKTLIYLNFFEYSTLYLVQNILPFCDIEALDSKRVLKT